MEAVVGMSGHHEGQSAKEGRETAIDEVIGRFLRRGRKQMAENAETATRRIFAGAGVEISDAAEELQKIAKRMRMPHDT